MNHNILIDFQREIRILLGVVEPVSELERPVAVAGSIPILQVRPQLAKILQKLLFSFIIVPAHVDHVAEFFRAQLGVDYSERIIRPI